MAEPVDSMQRGIDKASLSPWARQLWQTLNSLRADSHPQTIFSRAPSPSFADDSKIAKWERYKEWRASELACNIQSMRNLWMTSLICSIRQIVRFWTKVPWWGMKPAPSPGGLFVGNTRSGLPIHYRKALVVWYGSIGRDMAKTLEGQMGFASGAIRVLILL